MRLDRKDLNQFFRLHRSLMFFVNQRLNVLSQPLADPDEYSSLPPETRLKVHEAFLKHMDLIQEFVDRNPSGLSKDELDIVLSWRHLVHGTFYALRETKDYMVFLSSETPPVAYGVLPLTQPFEDLIGPHLPVMVKTCLLPFKGKIVYDSIISAFNVVFGPGVRGTLNDSYEAAKARHGIVTSLPLSEPPIGRKGRQVRPCREGRGRGTFSRTAVESMYPAVADFVRNQGHIEIGDQQGIGFVAKALDYGGLVFESKRAKTLAGALAALESGLAESANID